MNNTEQRVRALSERLRMSELRALEAWAMSWLEEASLYDTVAAPAISQADAEMHVPTDNRERQPESETEPAW
jgi:hypothetical protein